jgi:hypothetical protein
MVAIRFVGDEQKWPAITMLEGLKSLARIWLLKNSDGSRPSGEEEGDASTINDLPRVQHHGCQYPTSDETMPGPFSVSPGSIPGSMPPGASNEPSKAGPDDPKEVIRRTMDYRHRYRRRWANDHASASLLHQRRVVLPRMIVRVGETLHIMRPLVYSLCRWRLGSKRWTPLLASALMDFLSAYCVDVAAAVHAQAQCNGEDSDPSMMAAVAQAIVGRQIWSLMGPLFGVKAIPATFLERQDAALFKLFSFEDRAEFNRRRSMWMYYFLRDPLFDSITRPAFASVAGVLSYVPLVGGLADYAMFSLEYYQKKYFWFSASSSGR